MKSPGTVLPRNVPFSKSIATILTLTNHGTVGAVTDQGAALVNLYNDDAVDWHERRLAIELATTGGKGATPTAVGAAVTFSLFYAFTDTLLTAVADAPTILQTAESSLVCTLPNAVSTRASGTLTLAGNPANLDLIVIGSRSYSMRTTVTGPYQVKIAATAALTATNIINAINNSGGVVGTDYGSGAAAHPEVTAETGGAGIVTVRSIYYNTAGNSVVTTEDSTQMSWTGGTLAGGSAAGSRLYSTSPFEHRGKYLYVWYDRLAFAANALIDVTGKLIRL
jgi:hypothetical protein